MCSGLAEAVESVRIGGCGAELVEMLGLIDKLQAKISVAVGEFDRGGDWELDGFTSAIAWLKDKGRVTSGTASSMIRTARRMRVLPVMKTAWENGSLSSGQVAAVMANVKDEAMGLFTEHEAEVVPTLMRCSVAEVAAAMRLWSQRADAVLPDNDDVEPVRRLHVSRTLDGRTEITGSLDPESGEIVAAAIRLATTDDAEGEPVRDPATKRADAMVDIFRFFLNSQNIDTGGRNRSHLNIVLNFEDFTVPEDSNGGGEGRSTDGTVFDASAIRRLLCDAGVHRVITSGRSTILDYGTTTQSIPAPLWAALVIRDSHCRFPACDRPPKWSEGHHLHHYADGGPTNLGNLVMLCARHHHLLHRPKWSAELKANGDLIVTTPDGRVLQSSLPGDLRLPLTG